MALPEPVELFGINLHPCRMSEAVDELCGWIAAPSHDRCRYVVTPNVNHAVLLRRHEQFARVYAEADFVLADGAPIVLFSRVFGRRVPERVAGSDLVPRLFDRSQIGAPIRVYLLGARPEVNERATRRSKRAGRASAWWDATVRRRVLSTTTPRTPASSPRSRRRSPTC